MHQKLSIVFASILLLHTHAQAQPTEFAQPFVAYVRAGSGAISRFDRSLDRYVFTAQYVGQALLAKGALRAGGVLGTFYGDKHWGLMGGPTVSIKLKTFTAGQFGSLGNLNLALDHLWASDSRRLAGGGLQLDLLNKVVLGLHTHRDYKQGEWWLALSVAVRISKLKKNEGTAPQ